MKKFIFSACALALAIGFSAFTSYAPILTFSESLLDENTVFEADSYTSTPPLSCPGGVATPCRIDIAGYADEAAYLTHLSSLNAADAIADVKSKAIDFKN